MLAIRRSIGDGWAVAQPLLCQLAEELLNSLASFRLELVALMQAIFGRHLIPLPRLKVTAGLFGEATERYPSNIVPSVSVKGSDGSVGSQ